MLGDYLALAVVGLLVTGFIGWVITDEVRERRRARAAGRSAAQFQRKTGGR
jgi:uncharacterized protein YqgC (DUF456 family)